jgi:hypothetical protein
MMKWVDREMVNMTHFQYVQCPMNGRQTRTFEFPSAAAMVSYNASASYIYLRHLIAAYS